jgi:hypothetical protein
VSSACVCHIDVNQCTWCEEHKSHRDVNVMGRSIKEKQEEIRMMENTLPMAGYQALEGLDRVKVFELCDYASVAAFSQEEARSWYIESTGVEDTDLRSREEVTEVPFDLMVWDNEEMTEKIAVGEIVKQEWKGEPFIVCSKEW